MTEVPDKKRSFTNFQIQLLEMTILESIEKHNSHPLRNESRHKETFDKAIAAREDLIHVVKFNRPRQ